MDEQRDASEVNAEQAGQLSFWDQHRFLLLIAFTIIVALTLVSISLVIYNVSGAAQLDLSRPGFQAVASQADKDGDSFKTYSATGAVNSTTIKEFQSLYDAQVDSVKKVDAFGGDPLNADTIEYGVGNENE